MESQLDADKEMMVKETQFYKNCNQVIQNTKKGDTIQERARYPSGR